MTHETKLSAVLREFVRTLATDFPIQGILDHLVERIVDLLPITGAGVTLVSGNSPPRYIAASDSHALRFEKLQTALDEGPCLVLELTENILVKDTQRATTVLSDLRALGIRIAVDDFGTGYSSLNYLETLPIDIVKIDQSFIAKIDDAPRGQKVVAAVTDLAHVLGLGVTAEGVETKRQSEAVAAIGCEHAQGYYYSRPVGSAQIGEQLAVLRSPALLPRRAG